MVLCVCVCDLWNIPSCKHFDSCFVWCVLECSLCTVRSIPIKHPLIWNLIICSTNCSLICHNTIIFGIHLRLEGNPVESRKSCCLQDKDATWNFPGVHKYILISYQTTLGQWKKLPQPLPHMPDSSALLIKSVKL